MPVGGRCRDGRPGRALRRRCGGGGFGPSRFTHSGRFEPTIQLLIHLYIGGVIPLLLQLDIQQSGDFRRTGVRAAHEPIVRLQPLSRTVRQVCGGIGGDRSGSRAGRLIGIGVLKRLRLPPLDGQLLAQVQQLIVSLELRVDITLFNRTSFGGAGRFDLRGQLLFGLAEFSGDLIGFPSFGPLFQSQHFFLPILRGLFLVTNFLRQLIDAFLHPLAIRTFVIIRVRSDGVRSRFNRFFLGCWRARLARIRGFGF